MENPHSDLALCKLLGIKYPIIMAPMFLVSNEKMLIAASKKGIAGAIPALNYRTVEELRAGIRTIKAEATGPIGINLIERFQFFDGRTVAGLLRRKSRFFHHFAWFAGKSDRRSA